MNIVRGVAGLLRRSSNEFNASSTSESLLEENRQQLLEDNCWTEVEFNSDKDEEQRLGFLWEHYIEVSQNSDEIGAAEQARTDFLKFFLKIYDNWVPEELAAYNEQNISSKERCIILGCKSGHPTKVISGLINELKGVSKRISNLKTLIDEELEQIKFEETNDILHVLEILARAVHNRRIFRAYEGLQKLIHLMKAIVVQMKCIVGSINNETPESSSAGRLLIPLQGLLAHIVATVQHFVEESTTGALTITCSDDKLFEQANWDNLEVCSRRVPKEGTIPLMETGGLNWFVELLRIMRMLRKAGFPMNRSLQQLTLLTIKAALLGNSRAQNHFRSLGGIDVLLDAIGPPRSILQTSADLELQKSLLHEWSREDFQMQAALLEVLREAVFRNLSCLQYLFEKGGIDKFVGALIWSAFIWPKQHEPNGETDDDIVQGWNVQVSHLCKILCSFLVPSGDIRGFSLGLSASQDLFGKVGSYWELAMRWIVKVLLGIFKDMEFLKLPRSPSSTLQHYMLHVFRKMLAVSCTVLNAFREEGLWEVMFSKYFFYFEMDATDGNGPNDDGIDSEPLRLEVISLVELAATASNNDENGPECRALLKALQHCARTPSVSTMIVKSLHRILQLAPDQTVSAFKNLEALSSLSQVMDIQLQEFLKAQEVDDQSSRAFILGDSWKISRKAVFDLFAEYMLTSEEARIVSLHSPTTMQVIFDLLWDSESRKFALAHILNLMKLAPISRDDQQAKLELCIKYLESLSRSGCDGKPKDIEVLLDLLSGIREVLETDLLYYQTLFLEAECFVHIVSLLNENLLEEHARILCLSIIQTLTLLLARNSFSKNVFRSLVGPGYTTMQTLLINAHQSSPTEELVSAILDMLVDGDFNVTGSMVIQNQDAILLFFSMVRKSCETLQHFGLLTFNRFLEESIANKVACVKAGLLAFLLDWFDSGINGSLTLKLANLIETLGRHSVSGKDMRKIFSLLRNTNQSSKLATRKTLLDIVQGMLKEDGPSVFFEMNGKDSGIVITSPLQLPSSKGFSFSCWMRIESIPSVNDASKETCMGLFTFLTASSKGYNVMIGQKCLVVQVLGQKIQLARLNIDIKPKQWCHLCITHSVGRALTGGNVLKVYVDGSLTSSEKLRYPKLNEPLNKSSIGASSHFAIAEESAIDLMFSSPFCGQLGPIYLFSESLPLDQIAALFRAGSSYMYAFLPTEFGCIPDALIGNSIFDSKEGLASQMIFGFNAQATFQQIIHDVTYGTDGTTDELYHKAVILDGSQLCRRRLLKDILNCVGGVCVFFPLLTQLDQPYSPTGFLPEHEGIENTDGSHKSNVYVAAEVIELITSVLDNSYVHQQYMLQNKGLSVIGFLLQSISPQHLTTEVASALIHLLAVSSKSSGQNGFTNLLEETLTKIFLNLFIWIYTPYMVQRELLISLLNYCESNAGLAPSYVSFPRILDLVQRFYWDKPKNRKIAGSKQILHPATKEVIGERPNQEEVAKLRILLLSLAETAVRKSISMTDTKVLLAFILKCDDAICLEDILHMLLRLLGRKEFAAAFTENIQVLGGCQLFLGLLERQEETLRLLGLQIIGLLLISVPNEKKGSWLLSIATGVTRPTVEQQRAEKARFSALFAAITEKLIVFPFTDMLCATLFDVLLGGASIKQVLQGTTITGELASQNESLNSSQIVLPQAVGILMRFLLVCENLDTCIGVLRDILRLLEANPASSEAIVLEPSWQCWFFDLLIQSEEHGPHLNVEGDDFSMLKEKESLIFDIFTVIHCFCTYRLRGGWRHLERTVNFVHVYADKGLLLKYNLLHRMYRNLLETLFQARSADNLPMPQPCRDNVVYVMNLVDELVIEEAIHTQPFPKDELEDNATIGFGLPWLNIAMDTKMNEDNPDHSINQERPLMTKEGWETYDIIWDLIKDIHGRMKEKDLSVPSLGQRARGLVESINLPAAEMAAAVVAGGLGAVVSMNPSKMIDKAIKLRGDKFPRVVFHLVMMYIYKGDLSSASCCAHRFLSVLPLFLSTENEQCKNRLQLFIWCLLEARSQLALKDSGARFHLISQLLRETMDHGKNMLAASMLGKENSSCDTASVQSVLQQDRIINAVREENFYLRSAIVERSNEFKMLNSEMEETEELVKSNLKVLEDQLQRTLANLHASDAARTAAMQWQDDEDQQAVMNQWRHLFRSLTDERGPWSTVTSLTEVKISWKLDKTEDPWRRRLKLRRNYHFDEQKTFAQGCDVATLSSAPSGQASNLESLLETSKLLLKGLRGISEEVVADMREEEQTLLQENDADIQQNMAEALEPVKVEDVASASTTVQTTIKEEEIFTNEVLHSSACILISPKRKLAGRLDVTADTIYFHGEFLVEGTGGSSVFTSSGQIKQGEHIALDLVEQRLAGCKEYANMGIEKSVSPQKWNQVLPSAGPYQAIKGLKRHRRWELLKVKEVHGTRCLLQCTALEIFFDSSIPPVFFNFPSQKRAKDIGTSIISLRNTLCLGKGSLNEKPENKYFIDKKLALELAEHYKSCWRRREINNFEYLMHLNTLAGRSYNDLTQYPVFPWIIADYVSEDLDLSSSSSFRDLSKPVGALDEKRFEIFEERFQNFSDPDIPSFYYGSHYSSMGIVLFYLLRLEPFTSLHQNLQGGKFDHADRLFHSIDGAFKNCLTNTSDVKELIPEFFYMPEFLVNSNKYYMGIKQDGEQLDHVGLPLWAKGSPEEFVLKNREALETEYVSQHLHQWIDLIFGYKQRGGPAVEAANVFYHLTYEGAVDLESIEDRLQRAAVEDQIANFGQTPMQLFRKKHPRRGPAMPIARPLYYAPASITLTSSLSASMLAPLSAGEKPKALLFVGVVDSKVVLVSNDMRIRQRNWLTAFQAGGNFTFSSSQDPSFAIGAEVSQPHRLKGPFAESLELSSACFQTVDSQGLSYLLTCGFWDNSFRIMSLNDGSLQSYKRHKDVVSCIAVSSDGATVVTGSHDTTVMIWDVDAFLHSSKKQGLKDAVSHSGNLLIDKPLHVLSGHDDVVTCLAVSVELDLVVSGSRDSTCMLHTIREGRYVQSLQHPFRSSISRLVLSKHGLLVLFSTDDLLFLLYSINGKHLASSDSNGRINCIELSRCEEFLVYGGDQGQIIVRSIYTLEVVRRYEGIGTPILSLSVTPEDCFLAGLQDGSLLIYSIERPQQKKSNLLQVLRARS